MGKLLNPIQVGANEIRSAVYDLKHDLQVEKEQGQAVLHRCLVEALHCPDLWKKARWR